ncbi:putative ankyrin repeat domain-containing protein 31, partial [Limulus polyphemus]|uniref:Ankyrin repeat domain-containing protein 31 n=1 Tax=Limulus polyphemus TaxID=6850 RepID=A0ABM1C2T6_LIMPO
YLKSLIDHWIEEADLMRLEHVIIAGQGDKLIGRSSDNKQVQEFLDLVPAYMARIRAVHEAVVRGNLTEVKQVITRKRFALSRDHLGASPLHLAVLHGHSDVMAYIISQFPETMDGPDNEGRTPLHYAAVVTDGGKYYSILIHAGADNTIKDKYGHIPQDYLDQPDLLTIRDLLEGYKITENLHRKPSIVEVWHRPPTQEIEQKLTPVQSDEEEEEESPLQVEQTTAEVLIFPLLTTASEEDNQYLLDTVSDILVAGIREISLLKPDDPIAYLATWLYSYASHRASRERDSGNQSDDMTPEFERVLNQQTRNLQSRMKKLTTTANLGQRSENLEFLEEEKEDDEDNSTDIEDQTKMKVEFIKQN